MAERLGPEFRKPLAPYAAVFEEKLRGQGYAKSTIAGHMRLLSQLSEWLEGQGLEADGLMPEACHEFLGVRRGEGHRPPTSAKAVAPLLKFLRAQGLMSPPQPAVPIPYQSVLRRYHDYLVAERALAKRVVARWDQVASQFLKEQLEARDGFNPADIGASGVHAFLARQLPRVGSSAGKQTRRRASVLPALLVRRRPR